MALAQAGSFYKTPFGLSLSKDVLSLSKWLWPYDEAPRTAFDKLRQNGSYRQALE